MNEEQKEALKAYIKEQKREDIEALLYYCLCDHIVQHRIIHHTVKGKPVMFWKHTARPIGDPL